METLKKVISIIFGFSVIAFSILAILGIWDIVSNDIAEKSLATLGVIFFASFVSLIIVNNLSKKK